MKYSNKFSVFDSFSHLDGSRIPDALNELKYSFKIPHKLTDTASSFGANAGSPPPINDFGNNTPLPVSKSNDIWLWLFGTVIIVGGGCILYHKWKIRQDEKDRYSSGFK